MDITQILAAIATHTLAALAIAELGFTDRVSRRAAVWTAVVAANVADLELLGLIGMGWSGLLYSGGIMNGVLAWLLLPPAIGYLVGRFTRESGWTALWGLASAAYAAQLLLDLATSQGVALLAPFSYTRYATHWLYPADVIVVVLLGLPLWLWRLTRIPRPRAAAIALLLVGTYLGVCGLLHATARHRVAEALEEQGVDLSGQDAFAQAYPAPWLPLLWTGVAFDGNVYHRGRVVIGGEVELSDVRARNFSHPAAAAALGHPLARRFVRRWAHAPAAEVRCLSLEERQVVLRDLRYRSAWVDRRGFALVFDVHYDKTNTRYAVTGQRWLTPWSGGELPGTECDFVQRATGI